TLGRRQQGRSWFEAGVPSFGDGALARVTGAAFTTHPGAAPLAAALDTALTHAHPLAVEASVVYVDALVELISCRGGWTWLRGLATKATHPQLRIALEMAAHLRNAPTTLALHRLGNNPDASTTLAIALWLLCSQPDGASAVAIAASWPQA